MDFQIDKIYNEDCLEGMKRIADGAVDCIISDLPYGSTRNPWDSVIPLDQLWGAKWSGTSAPMYSRRRKRKLELIKEDLKNEISL
jgi:DNA modification methylase